MAARSVSALFVLILGQFFFQVHAAGRRMDYVLDDIAVEESGQGGHVAQWARHRHEHEQEGKRSPWDDMFAKNKTEANASEATGLDAVDQNATTGLDAADRNAKTGVDAADQKAKAGLDAADQNATTGLDATDPTTIMPIALEGDGPLINTDGPLEEAEMLVEPAEKVLKKGSSSPAAFQWFICFISLLVGMMAVYFFHVMKYKATYGVGSLLCTCCVPGGFLALCYPVDESPPKHHDPIFDENYNEDAKNVNETASKTSGEQEAVADPAAADSGEAPSAKKEDKDEGAPAEALPAESS